MASILDIGLLNTFSPIFTFILLFALIYAILEFAKIFGENKNIHGLIAFVVALIASLSKGVVATITLMVP